MPEETNAKMYDFGARLREKIQKPRGFWADLVEELDAQGIAFTTTFTDDQVIISWQEEGGRASTPFWRETGDEVHPRA